MRMGETGHLTLTLPNDLSYLPIALLCVRETARKFGFEDDDLYKIEVGLEECITNVIEHAFSSGEASTFDIICERTALGITVTVKEKGIPFDPARLPKYEPGKDLEAASGSGLGVFLMKKMLDDVCFINLGADGKETRLIKHLPSKRIDDYYSQAELKAMTAQKEPEVIKEKIDYDVRALQQDEAIEVSRCAYKSHGYTFFDQHIYYPDRLLELNRSGQLVSAVAVTKDNRFMGHAALHYPYKGARIAELTFVFVNVEYRGQGCMNRLCEYLFTTPDKSPLSGVYAYAVTNHVFTQKVMVKYGIQDCGLELATSPETWVFKGITPEKEEHAQRISVALSFKYLVPPTPLTLYPPPQHREMVEYLYRNLGATDHCYAVPPGSAPDLPAQHSEIETDIHASEQNVEILIRRCGIHVIREMRLLVRDLCLKHMAAINLLLSLEDPATYFLTTELEQIGFFFSGILPRTGIGDALVLQYLNNVDIDYDKVMVYTDTARKILEYIKARDPNVIR